LNDPHMVVAGDRDGFIPGSHRWGTSEHVRGSDNSRRKRKKPSWELDFKQDIVQKL